ncbi:hypothetical protein [Nostoc linckia]|uniref:hypothetical protein n=1 Tax=Nostoc linckia TaxID=92942 RepID=UPI00117C8BDE|nr:hypothetical protein [Nostoc linckia]
MRFFDASIFSCIFFYAVYAFLISAIHHGCINNERNQIMSIALIGLGATAYFLAKDITATTPQPTASFCMEYRVEENTIRCVKTNLDAAQATYKPEEAAVVIDTPKAKPAAYNPQSSRKPGDRYAW